jgi:hypothetical protein
MLLLQVWNLEFKLQDQYAKSEYAKFDWDSKLRRYISFLYKIHVDYFCPSSPLDPIIIMLVSII